MAAQAFSDRSDLEAMMGLGNKQDAIDKLLRVSGARPGDPPQACREFDADLANAYVERSLTTGEIARYEQHLSACAPCRKSVVALARMAAADPVLAHANAKAAAFGEPRAEQRTARKPWFSALLTPRWAMAAAAMIVLAISLPFLLAPKKSQNAQGVSATANAPATDQFNDALKSESGKPGEAVAANAPTPPAPSVAASNPQARAEKESAPAPEPVKAPSQSAVTTVEVPPPADALATTQTPKPAAEKPAPVAEATAKTTEPAPSSVAGGATPPRQTEQPLPRIDADNAKKLDVKDKAETVTLRPGRGVGEERDEKKEATIRPDQNIAPPPKPQTPEPHGGARKMSAREVGSALRGGGEMARSSRSRLPGKKIAKKQFWLRDNVWTDEDYNPDKDIPVTTIIRDSDVYKEVMVERAGTKPYLTGFGENESVIFVYKGTVYKLVPQKDGK